ncbi:MAG TPA: hypothetical protein PLK04_11530 [Bacillota bacterium]|nr:hypothetical protein [Bacillota bacterium]
MAEILRQESVSDGYDVTCRLSNGMVQTFHFLEQPLDVVAAVTALEQQFLASSDVSGEQIEWEIIGDL